MQWCSEGHELQPKDKFCGLCGEKPVTECGNGHDLRSVYDQDRGLDLRPDFCQECGERYPWAP